MFFNAVRRFVAVLLVFVFSQAGFAGKKEPEPRASAVPAVLAPTKKQRPIMDGLVEFGKLLRVAFTATGEREIIIEIAPILNKTGKDKELPPEIGQWIREAIAKIGPPLRTYEAVPAAQLVRPVFSGSAGPADRPPHAPLSYRLTGVLQRAFEREISGRELEFYLRLGNGHTSADGQTKRNKRTTITRLTLSLTLEQPDGLDAATATYFVDVLKTESDGNWGFFVGGSGVGGGTNLTVADDFGDSIFDLASTALMNVIGSGSAVLVPYYRCSSVFPVDEALNERQRHQLNRMIRAELEQTVKPYLFLSGIDMDMGTAAVTPHDREQITALMRSRGLDFADRAALGNFVFDQWQSVRIDEAADRLEKRIEEVIRKIKEQQAAQAAAEAAAKAREAAVKAAADAVAKTREAAGIIDASRFGWPDSTPMILIDVTGLTDESLRKRIRLAAQACDGCEEVRQDTAGAIVAVRLRAVSGFTSADQQTTSCQKVVEQALSRARLNVEYQWIGEHQKRLRVVPNEAKVRNRKHPSAPASSVSPNRIPAASALQDVRSSERLPH